MAFQHEEIEVDHTGQLAEREPHGQPVAYIHGHVQDEHEQGEIEHGHQGLEGTVRRYGQHEAAVQGQAQCGQCCDPGAGIHDAAAQGSFFVQGYSDSRDQRKNDAAEEEQLQHGRLT